MCTEYVLSVRIVRNMFGICTEYIRIVRNVCNMYGMYGICTECTEFTEYTRCLGISWVFLSQETLKIIALTTHLMLICITAH